MGAPQEFDLQTISGVYFKCMARVAKIIGGGLVLILLSQAIFLWLLGNPIFLIKSSDLNLGNVISFITLIRVISTIVWMFLTLYFSFFVMGKHLDLGNEIRQFFQLPSLKKRFRNPAGIASSTFSSTVGILVMTTFLFEFNNQVDRGFKILYITIILFGGFIFVIRKVYGRRK
jgi:hypothetical protein